MSTLQTRGDIRLFISTRVVPRKFRLLAFILRKDRKGKVRKMKKLLKVLLVCTMAFTLAACGGNSGSDGTKEILIGISPDYPPYESLEGKDMVGFDIDMTKELFKIMNDNGGNYEYKFKQMSFDTISTSLISDQIDLGISGFTMHKDWDVLWSDKYNDSRQVALVANDSTITTKADLEGKNIGAQLAATGERC